jgi:hypothetical protein
MAVLAGALALALVSGGSRSDPRTPVGLPGLPPPFLGTAVVGGGGLTAAIDAYGNLVDLRAPGPGGRALIDNPAARQAAGSVAAGTGIVPRLRIGGGEPLPLWRADSVVQRYLPGTNVVRTVARFGRVTIAITAATSRQELARIVDVRAPSTMRVRPAFGVDVEPGVRCGEGRRSRRLTLVCSAGAGPEFAAGVDPAVVGAEARRIVSDATSEDRRWVARARPLGSAAPEWAQRLYRRSLLVLRALTDRRTGAVAAGARDGWAYVWPRDAGTAALAFAAAGYRPEARRVARFLLELDLDAAARFHGDGTPVAGREAQGDAPGWVGIAAHATGLPFPNPSIPWRERADYREGERGNFLANAISAKPASWGAFETPRGLVRRAGDPRSGLDSAAAWAVRPFALAALFPASRRTLLRLAGKRTRFGITPGESWTGVDPWSAPTAWTAWSLAALGERRQALRLLADLRRAATPAGALPERVDAHTGIPASTTPLAWSHALAILALRELWPMP